MCRSGFCPITYFCWCLWVILCFYANLQPKITNGYFNGDFLKFGGLVGAFYCHSICKFSNNRFPNFSSFFLAQEQTFLKLVIFTYRGWVVWFLRTYDLSHGAGVECIPLYFNLSFIFFPYITRHKYLGKNRVAHCFPLLVFFDLFEVLAKPLFYLFNPLTVIFWGGYYFYSGTKVVKGLLNFPHHCCISPIIFNHYVS